MPSTPPARTLGVAVALLSLTALPVAYAADSAPSSLPREAAARSRYEQGVAAYTGGRFADAVALFKEADRLEPSAAIAFDSAKASEKLGDDAGALRGYRDYLRRAGNPDDASDVRKRIAVLDERLTRRGLQQVTVLTTPAGATVTLDGEPVGVSPWTGERALGQHDVLVRLDGYRYSVRRVHLTTAAALDVDLVLVPEPKPASLQGSKTSATPPPHSNGAATTPTHDTPPAHHGSTLSTVGIITLSAGGAALAGSLAFELVRRNAENDAKTQQEQVKLQNDIDTMKSSKDASRILLGVGVPLVVTGGVLLYVGSKSKSEKTPAVGVSFSSTNVAGTFRGRF